MTKKEIENQIIECLTNSDMKMSTYDISKITGIKPDKIYITLTNKKIKFKNVNQVIRWYVNENQKDLLPIKIEKKKEDLIVKGLFENLKDGNRKIFLTMDDYQNYKNKDNKIVKIEKKIRRIKR